MSNQERINWIKDKIIKIKHLRDRTEYLESDEHLYDLSDDGHIEWLVSEVERLTVIEQAYEAYKSAH